MNTPRRLVRAVGPSKDTLETAEALQHHTEIVSDPDPAAIARQLAAEGFKLVGAVIDPRRSAGQAYVARRGDQVVVAFRGSGGTNFGQTLINAANDARVLRVAPTELLPDARERRIKVHKGFYTEYLDVRGDIRERLATAPGCEVFVTGFSLGSALATLTALDLGINPRGLRQSVSAYLFGTPRVGNPLFRDLYDATVPDTLRVVNREDPVPRTPAPLLVPRKVGYLHIGRLLEVEADGRPVPFDRISGRLVGGEPALKAHSRDAYRLALGAFLREHLPFVTAARQGDDPLRRAALAEAQSLMEGRRGMEDEDDPPG